VRALRDVELEIRQGEFVAIVGTSGSGKSTLMNILGCLDRPTRGSYELAGFDIGARSSDARAILRNRLIGFIFQGFNLLPRTTALENVELPLVYRGVSSRERRKLALQALDSVGLGERVHHTPNQLSGGQQQRVAIARALVTGPPMLLADEPTGNLDTRTSLEVLALLQRLNRERGITIVLVTHEHDIAACASRVVTFRDGRIVSDVREPSVDAAAELARLPVADAGRGTTVEDESGEQNRLGGPVPRALYAVTALGALVGILLGVLYSKAVLDISSTAIPAAFAFVFEGIFAAWFARRSFGRPLTSDQRVRVALNYTMCTTALLALPTILGWLPWSKPIFDRLGDDSGPKLGVSIVLLSFAFMATLALARYLLLSLIGSLGIGAPAHTEKQKPA
jgi:putative ABC transport system ATP-binding protein